MGRGVVERSQAALGPGAGNAGATTALTPCCHIACCLPQIERYLYFPADAGRFGFRCAAAQQQNSQAASWRRQCSRRRRQPGQGACLMRPHPAVLPNRHATTPSLAPSLVLPTPTQGPVAAGAAGGRAGRRGGALHLPARAERRAAALLRAGCGAGAGAGVRCCIEAMLTRQSAAWCPKHACLTTPAGRPTTRSRPWRGRRAAAAAGGAARHPGRLLRAVQPSGAAGLQGPQPAPAVAAGSQGAWPCRRGGQARHARQPAPPLRPWEGQAPVGRCSAQASTAPPRALPCRSLEQSA